MLTSEISAPLPRGEDLEKISQNFSKIFFSLKVLRMVLNGEKSENVNIENFCPFTEGWGLRKNFKKFFSLKVLRMVPNTKKSENVDIGIFHPFTEDPQLRA